MITDSNIEYVVVFGLGPAGLFVSRQLKKLGKRVIGIGKHDDIGRYSNTLERCYLAEDATGLLAAVKDVVKYVSRRPEALICSDGYLTFIIEECPEIFDLLSFSSPSESILRLMNNKEQLSKKMRTLGMQMPHIFATSLSDFKFPIIVKPIIKRKKSPIPKVSYVQDELELTQLIKKAENGGLTISDLILQQFVNGNNESELGYGGYFENGNLINDVAFIQARQYPQGVSCTAIEISDESEIHKLREITSVLINDLQYTGFMQFDIKRDSISGEYYILDVNPRPWGSISLMSPKGDNRNGNIFISSNLQSRNAMWHFPLKELMSIRNPKNTSFLRCNQIVGGHSVTIVDLWDKNDVKPFFMQWLVSIKKLIG